MSTATLLLTTKLYRPPPRPNLVLRPRLLQRLHEGLTRRLTLISAPAGFGKSMLVSAWLHHRPGSEIEQASTACPPHAVAWLSLEGDDNDPTRFCRYLIAALQILTPQVGETALALLLSSHPPPLKAILTTLINDLAALAENDPTGSAYLLVLDDYHVIDAPPIHETITFLLDHLPPYLHVIMATRIDPPLPLARWRARNQLTELRAQDLRFTQDEAAVFLQQTMQLPLSADHSAALATRTEGWIAGCTWRPSRCKDTPTFPLLSKPLRAASATLWTTWSKKCCSANRSLSKLFCCKPPSWSA